jgi:tetratricopeptide (TPR) repeat protein
LVGPGDPARRAVRTSGGGSIITGLTEGECLPTTSGGIAVANLQAQIDGLAMSAHRTRSGRAGPAAMEQALLVDLLLLRGRMLGRIADYARAAELAEALVRDAPDDGTAWLARARDRATFHRFPEALADLDAAGRRGADRAVVDAERAAILQAVGCYDDALVLRRTAAERRPDFTTLGALAVLQAERGAVTEAENLFTEARRRYRGVSPFPVAELDFRRGLMWLGERDLPAARAWFAAAVRRVPAHAPALGHLAEVHAALGAHDAAIDRLRPLAGSSDDPEYAATLAGVLSDAGQPLEAERWRVSAAARYDELVLRHPAAFADHAAEFWLTVGGDRPRGLRLIERHRADRRTARWHARLRRATPAG